jgi:hypothetical protein
LPAKAVKERIPTKNVLLGKYFSNILTVFKSNRFRKICLHAYQYTAVDCAFHYRSSDL